MTKDIDRPAGRPEYRPTAAARRRVAVAAGAGMRHDVIASALGISPVTLRKHFRVELSTGAAQRRMEEGLFRAARRGSASAAKAYLAHAPEARGAATWPAREPSPPKKGKKQRTADAAKRAAAPGTRFAPGEPPRLVVDNGGAHGS